MKSDSIVSRRQFLAGSGLVVAATTVGAAGVGLGGFSLSALATPIPWPYKEIDPDKAAQIAYDAYFEHG